MIKAAASKFINSKRFVIYCFVTGIVLRVLWLMLVNSKPVSDSSWYYQQGLDIAAGKGYNIEGTPTAYYPAGYPMFLSLIFMMFGNSIAAAKIANLFISAGILYFSYFISKKLFDSEKTGRITLLLLAIYPNYISYTSILATELLFSGLLFFGAYLVLISKNRIPVLIAAGIVWGAMCLVKPQGIFIPLLFLAAWFFQNGKTIWERTKPVIILYVFMIAVIAPWAVRNYMVFGSPFISTNDGINLVIGNNPYATGDYNLNDMVVAYIWDNENEYPSPDSLVSNIHKTQYWTRWGFKDENYANIKLRNKALNYIANNPGKVLKLLPGKLWLNYKRGNEGIGWATSELEITPQAKDKSIKIFSSIANYFYYAVMILSVLYLIIAVYKKISAKQKTRFPLLELLLISYFTFLSLVYFGSYRFSFPTIPLFIMFAAAFIEIILREKNG